MNKSERGVVAAVALIRFRCLGCNGQVAIVAATLDVGAAAPVDGATYKVGDKIDLTLPGNPTCSGAVYVWASPRGLAAYGLDYEDGKVTGTLEGSEGYSFILGKLTHSGTCGSLTAMENQRHLR